MSALEHVKEIATLIQKYQDQELYQKIVDLRDEIFAIREENLELKERLRNMDESAIISKQLIRSSNHYIRTFPDGTRLGPFCLACWDSDKKLINLQEFAYGIQKCGRCDKK